jgi:hypothetical protein
LRLRFLDVDCFSGDKKARALYDRDIPGIIVLLLWHANELLSSLERYKSAIADVTMDDERKNIEGLSKRRK